MRETKVVVRFLSLVFMVLVLGFGRFMGFRLF